MSKYKIVISWSKRDDLYIARVPELAGCAADGDTPQEALSNVTEVIDIWLQTAKREGWEIPVPQEDDDLQAAI